MTIFLQLLTLFEILKQRRKHPRFVCFLSPDLYLLFAFPKISNNCFIQRCNSSVCLTHFTGYSSSLSTPSSSSSPRLHTCQSNSHHSDLRAETFKSGSSSGSVTERERERFCNNCLPMLVARVVCHAGTLSTLQRCVYLVSHMPLTSIKIRYILSLEGVLVH